MPSLGYTGLRPAGYWHEVFRLSGVKEGSRSLGRGHPTTWADPFPSPHTLNGAEHCTCTALPALPESTTTLQPQLSARLGWATSAGLVVQKGGAAWWQGWWEDPGCHGDCSWSQNANLENVDRGPLQPLSRRRPFIRRQSIRNEPNIGARQPRFSSATRWLLTVQLKVTSMASDMGSLTSHNHVLGSIYHREALSPIPAPNILMWAPGQPDLTPSSLVPFIHHLGSH